MVTSPGARDEHRPWPPPTRPWSWRQTCRDVLFLHWPVPVATLRPLVPDALEIDVCAGSAWTGLVALELSDVGADGWPSVPGLSRFPQLNVRTYVRHGDRPGVWFFSLDAGNRLAAWVARRVFHLPYFHARMRVRRTGSAVSYHALRAGGPAFAAEYAPRGPSAPAVPGTLEHWLTERDCLYAASGTGQLYRAEITHEPWPLQGVDAVVHRNGMLHALGLALARPPVERHYASGVRILAWSPELVR